MSTGLHGADPEDLRQFAVELEHATSVLLTVKNDLSAKINNSLRWEGPDAFVFRHAWQSSYAPVIGQTAALFESTAQMVKAHAAEQESASG
ncbi:hypothetical protein ACX80E_07265 [Arthrobacter sp. TMN-49]